MLYPVHRCLNRYTCARAADRGSALCGVGLDCVPISAAGPRAGSGCRKAKARARCLAITMGAACCGRDAGPISFRQTSWPPQQPVSMISASTSAPLTYFARRWPRYLDQIGNSVSMLLLGQSPARHLAPVMAFGLTWQWNCPAPAIEHRLRNSCTIYHSVSSTWSDLYGVFRQHGQDRPSKQQVIEQLPPDAKLGFLNDLATEALSNGHSKMQNNCFNGWLWRATQYEPAVSPSLWLKLRWLAPSGHNPQGPPLIGSYRTEE
jgi:hypothetical protein